MAPLSLCNRDDLVSLLTNAGFADVQPHHVSIDARFADAARFVERMEFAYAAVIPQFAEDPAAFSAYLEAINEETRDIVAPYRQGDEVVVPMHATLAVATAH